MVVFDRQSPPRTHIVFSLRLHSPPPPPTSLTAYDPDCDESLYVVVVIVVGRWSKVQNAQLLAVVSVAGVAASVVAIAAATTAASSSNGKDENTTKNCERLTLKKISGAFLATFLQYISAISPPVVLNSIKLRAISIGNQEIKASPILSETAIVATMIQFKKGIGNKIIQNKAYAPNTSIQQKQFYSFGFNFISKNNCSRELSFKLTSVVLVLSTDMLRELLRCHRSRTNELYARALHGSAIGTMMAVDNGLASSALILFADLLRECQLTPANSGLTSTLLEYLTDLLRKLD
nr:hypothetical protein Iba_chr01cCG3660 [Ipomoea batatas]